MKILIRTLFLMLVFFHIVNLANAQVTVMQENFEHAGALPTGWTNSAVSGTANWTCATGGYNSYPATAHGGTYNAQFYSGNYNGDKTKLVTSVINLNNYSGCQLTFWHAQVMWDPDVDTLRVYYKTSAGGSWVLLQSFSGEAATWTQRTLSLPNPCATYYLAFQGESHWGYGVCVDDITVTGAPSSILLNAANDGQTYSTCDAMLYDEGGANGNYFSINADYEVTFASTNGGCIRAVLEMYHTEMNYDYIYVYDGIGSATSPQLGQAIHAKPYQYVGTIDKTGNAYIAQSGYITIRFKTDGATSDTGFVFKIDCPDNCIAPSCTGTTPAGDYCESASPICDFNGYCGNTDTLVYTTDHDEIDNYHTGIFCGGINNNSWLSFVADSTTAILDVWVSNCRGSFYGTVLGIQLEVFDTDCNTFLPVSNCWSPSEMLNGQIKATGLTVGHTYILMIDGYARDQCEYVFAASQGVIAADAGTDKTVCEGQPVTLTASGGTSVTWASTPVDPDLASQEHSFSIYVSPSETTTYTATVSGSNPDCPGTADAVVFVNQADATFTGLATTYCINGAPVTLSGNFISGVFSGDGVTGSTFNPATAGLGVHDITYTYNYSVVTAFFEDFDPSPTAGWVHGSTGSDSWATGKPHGGNGANSYIYSNPDPLADHSSGIDNNVYGQGLGAGTGDGVGGYYDNASEWLKSPAINCTGLSNVTVSFWRYANFEPDYDEAYVKISTDNSNWITMTGEPLYPEDDHWVQRIIDISQWADNQPTVYIRWSDANDGSQTYSGWNIDDVTVTGVQAGGSCVSTDVQRTTVNPLPTSTFNTTNPSCSYSNSTITYTGGAAGGATYTWNFGGGTVVSGSGQGPYTVSYPTPQNYTVTLQVTESGCTSTITSHTITEPSAISLSTSSVNSSCGSSNGSATVTPSGGAGGYNYSWSGGGASNTITNKPSGSYSVTVTDASGCTAVTSVNISDAGAPSSTIGSVVHVTCNGAANGSATVTATGGASPYTYHWSNGGSNSLNSGLSGGTYTVTVTDNSNCTATASVTISEPTALTASVTCTNVLCNGASTGNATVTAGGGTPAYSYSWTGGQTTTPATNLVAGTYTVTVTDFKGCTRTSSVTITQPAGITTTIVPTNVLCYGGATGAANLTLSGGASPYTYYWSNGQTTEDISGVIAGTYTVSIQDANSCTKTASVTITQPVALSTSMVTTPVGCFGETTGSADLTVSGGISPYTYYWNSGQSSQDLMNVAAGNYTVTVTDANGCTVNAATAISQPATITANITGTNVLCNGENTGAANLSVSGGTAPYSYSWSSGASSEDLSNLPAATYTVTVTDLHNCTKTTSVTLTQPTLIVLTASHTNSACGSSNGTATVSASGGVGSYTYHWSNGGTSAAISNLASGAYTVTVTDANGCTKTATENVNDNNAATVNISASTPVSCFGGNNGSASVSVSGGTTPYNYYWTNGSTGNNANGLVAGIHSVTVTDANNCQSSASVTITQPTAITGTTTPTNVTCYGLNNGGVGLTVSGGTPGYTFYWSSGSTSQNLSGIGPNTYTVNVTDLHFCTATFSTVITQPLMLSATTSKTDATCYSKNDGAINITAGGGTQPFTYNWSNGSGTEDLTQLVAGPYSVTITDANYCTFTSSVTITQPTAIVLSATVTNILCNGGSAGSVNLTVSGGTPSYNYEWSNGVYSEDLNAIPAGVYTVTITDANLCNASNPVTVTEPALLTASIVGTDAHCNGTSDGRADLSVSGGTPPYDYSWNYGPTSQDLLNISAGSYDVTVTDNNNCMATASVTITQPTSLVINLTGTSPLCNGESSGSVSITVTGGTPAYFYLWSDGTGSAGLTNITAGTYSVTVTDVNDCSSTSSVIITEPAVLSIATIVNHITCYGNDNGSIVASPIGGTSPYNYTWSSGSTDASIFDLPPATYSITLTDANSCITASSITITEPAVLTATISNYSSNICHNSKEGYAEVLALGGTGPYHYAWSDNLHQADSLADGLPAGTYYISVTDGKSCFAADTVTIVQADAIAMTYKAYPTSCIDAKDGSVSVSVVGGTSPYFYSWSNGLITDNLKDIGGGTYLITITDSKSCLFKDSVIVIRSEETCLEIPNCFTPNGDNKNDKWVIKHVELYPDIEVEVYNRWGILLFKSTGYQEAWDGTHNGKELPMGAYLYIINLHDNTDVLTGAVTIIR